MLYDWNARDELVKRFTVRRRAGCGTQRWGGIASPRSAVPEAHDRPGPALDYVHNDRPVPDARGRAPSPRQVPIIQFPYVDACGQLPA